MFNETSDHFDLYGYVGQVIFRTALIKEKIDFEESPYFDESLRHDDFDFKVKGFKIDVKTTYIGTNKNFPFLVRADKREKDKKINIYFQIRLDLAAGVGYLYGAVSYKKFWQNAVPFTGPLPKPGYSLDLSFLIPFDGFIAFLRTK